MNCGVFESGVGVVGGSGRAVGFLGGRGTDVDVDVGRGRGREKEKEGEREGERKRKRKRERERRSSPIIRKPSRMMSQLPHNPRPLRVQDGLLRIRRRLSGI
jgi:hypothetical protein